MATGLQQHTMEVHALCALEVAVTLIQAQAVNGQLLAVYLLTLGAQLARSGLASSSATSRPPSPAATACRSRRQATRSCSLSPTTC